MRTDFFLYSKKMDSNSGQTQVIDYRFLSYEIFFLRNIYANVLNAKAQINLWN